MPQVPVPMTTLVEFEFIQHAPGACPHDYDITQDVINGLNKRYKPSAKKDEKKADDKKADDKNVDEKKEDKK